MRGLIGDSRAETTTSGVLATASDRCSEPVRMSRLSGSSRAGTTIPRVLRAPAATAVAETKMAGRLSAFFKNAWAKEPVLVASFTIGGLAIVLPPLSPYTKYAARINQVTPYNYPVPVRDDGNMPDIPSHPQDPQGPSLEWLKKL
ncbi:NADH:ubiquinone oxidoreductase subunit A3 [Rhinolophus ferrumequinum]|nr:NADH dehydrogenase [ubiquinone] 1 alpha subcomplex subunit 3 [Rhinolophus ferrumequinum]KAF6288641.1 NADH:ubiquinone oxidoreductase subunit A3 [Rhinolophus ferrumequinum]